jgi:hypothetical protein
MSRDNIPPELGSPIDEKTFFYAVDYRDIRALREEMEELKKRIAVIESILDLQNK